MPKFVIERDVPGAGQLNPEQLRALAQKSRDVLSKLGTDIQWIKSYVTGNKLYCIYIAPSEELIYKHAQLGGFPANSVCRVSSILEPASAEA
jgi:hypothetical protein